MVEHLRKLPIRETVDGVGFDAYCTFVVNADNQGHVALPTALPAPQVGDRDHYETFLDRIGRLYAERYNDLANLPKGGGLSVEESLVRIAEEHPGLLDKAGQLAIDSNLDGAAELQAILQSIEWQVNPPAPGEGAS